MGSLPQGKSSDPAIGHTTTPVSTDDLVRVVSRALAEGGRRIRLTAGQRRAILRAPLRAGAGGAAGA